MIDYQYANRDRPVRLGLVGGGPGSFAGIAHPIAARLDGRFSIVAGVFSSHPDRSADRAAIHGVARDRAYATLPEMVEAESARRDGVEAVAVITPRQSHFAVAKIAVDAGLHVICEKPISESAAEAEELASLVAQKGVVFCLTHNYSGYPMVREARQMVQSGAIGDIRMLEAQFILGRAAQRDEGAAERKPWNFDLAAQGYSWIMLEVGTHVEHIARFVTGLRPVAVCAEINSASPIFGNDDTAMLLVRYENGARAVMWFSFAAAGCNHDLKFRVHGKSGGLEWRQDEPERLVHSDVDRPRQTRQRGELYLSTSSRLAERISRGHPEGFHEAFANLYRDFGEAIRARQTGTLLAPEFATFPTAEDGVLTLRFSEAAYRSAICGSAWTPV